MENSPSFKWTTEFMTVADNGACSSYVFVIMASISFSASLCRERKKKLYDSPLLHVVEMARVA